MAHDIFISYSSADRNVGLAACSTLEERGFRCWIAPRNILPGQDWGEAIIDGISGARLFVMIFSSHANVSHQVRREIERAVNRGLPIIPFRIEDVPPSKSLEYFMSAPHWLDALTPPLERHLDYLADVAGHLLAGAPPPGPPAAPAEPRRSSRSHAPWWAGAAALAALVAALAVILTRPESVPVPLPEQAEPAAPAGLPAAEAPDSVDFRRAPTDTAPGHWVAAEPFLHAAPVRTRSTGISPDRSRLVIINSVDLYEGRVIGPTFSQNMLTLLTSPDPLNPENRDENEPTTFTLEFAEPISQFSFMVPMMYAATESGFSFPAFSAQALGPSGEPLDGVSRELRRAARDAVPPETFTLTARPGTGIKSVRFTSDYRLDGRPFAAFRTLLIERITYRPM